MVESGEIVVTTFDPPNIDVLRKIIKTGSFIMPKKTAAEVVMGVSIGDYVIFKRDIINEQFLVEFGTSGAFLSYKVVEIEDVNNTAKLQPEFGYPFTVPIQHVEHRQKDYNPDELVAQLAGKINSFEHCES
jgi:hypothetical protein